MGHPHPPPQQYGPPQSGRPPGSPSGVPHAFASVCAMVVGIALFGTVVDQLDRFSTLPTGLVVVELLLSPSAFLAGAGGIAFALRKLAGLYVLTVGCGLLWVAAILAPILVSAPLGAYIEALADFRAPFGATLVALMFSIPAVALGFMPTSRRHVQVHNAIKNAHLQQGYVNYQQRYPQYDPGYPQAPYGYPQQAHPQQGHPRQGPPQQPGYPQQPPPQPPQGYPQQRPW